MSTRRGGIAAALVVAAVAAVWLAAGRSDRRPTVAVEPSELPQQAPAVRRDYPRLADMLPAARPDGGAAVAATSPSAAVQPPPPAQVIKVGSDGPTPSPQLASAWAIDYRDAVCACHTRRCVGDLQGGFVRKLGAIVQGDESDDTKYTEATRAALRCYFALPEGS
jgi:hypothetical protein